MNCLFSLIALLIGATRDSAPLDRCHSDPTPAGARNRQFAIRESVRNLPFQFFWTWLSGCPLPGEEPLVRRTPLMHTLDSIVGFLLALVLGSWLILSGLIWPLPLVLLLATGRARKSYITIEHQVVHSQLFHIKLRDLRQFCNQLIGEFIGVLFWVPEPDLYHQTHAGSHHKNRDVATPRDKDGAPIFKLGFLPGMQIRQYWSLLWCTVFSPRFYFQSGINRLWLSLVTSSRKRIIMSWAFLAALLLPLSAVKGWWAVLLVYSLSVFVGFPAAGLLQMCGKHFWGCHLDKLGTSERTALVCQGRFLLDPYPSPGSSHNDYICFWARLFGYHLPVRIAVLNGDVQHHDWHHRIPGSAEWTESSFARMRDINAGCPNWSNLPSYTHSWSLGESIARTFQEMAAAPPLTEEWLAVVNNQADGSDVA
ncbi:MAG TPA: hypothetical protein PLY87_00970 [Planctomycetaceae bacterium]|nr:hypothetical protein [Planctomycetaceae bacterium]